ncbi:MAG: hypothetical protein ABR963_03870 [Acidimicrobiales bacterium]
MSFVLGEEPGQLEMTSEEVHVVDLFHAQGLIPLLRYQPSTTPYTG